MTDVDTGPATVDAFLRQPLDGPISMSERLRGFGGLHGGLCVALMTSAMQLHAPEAPLVGVTAQFHRAIRSPFHIDANLARNGRAFATVASRAFSGSATHVTASAVFSRHGAQTWPPVSPTQPAVPEPTQCAVFSVPPTFVPISELLEIRPVDGNRPFIGGVEPTLTAWVRLIEDDNPPDLTRLLFLLDALAPSYAAVLSEPRPVPTIELSVRSGNGLQGATSPWVLLSARTSTASQSGWVDERIDAWSANGYHLAAAHQLRLVQP